MTDWSALESPLKPVLDPRVFVEPRDRDPASEDDRQAVFVNRMRRDAKQCEIAANPNAGKRSQWALNKVMREGLLLGRNDIDVKWAPSRLALIEFKDGTKMPEPHQIERLNRAVEMGFPVAVCRTAEGAMHWLASLGAPVE